MFLKTAFLPAAAALTLFGTAASAQMPPIPMTVGWNYVEMVSCWLHTLPAVPPATVGLEQLVVGIAVVPAPPLVIPPGPVVQDGEIDTTDPIIIGVAAPFCDSGHPFWVWWDGSRWTMAAVYPHKS